MQMVEPAHKHNLTPLRLYLIGASALFMLLLPAALSVFAAEGNGYTGWKTCAGCHDDIAARWQTSRHAKAFDSLKKTNQQNLPKCVACHVTGYEQPGGFIDDELTPELIAVQCEACHGEGGNHAAGAGKTAIQTAPPVEVCRQCHTPGQDPNFDYHKKTRKIHETGSNAKETKK
jgi:hypothetical protein